MMLAKKWWNSLEKHEREAMIQSVWELNGCPEKGLSARVTQPDKRIQPTAPAGLKSKRVSHKRGG